MTDDEALDVDSLLVAYERHSDPPRPASHYEQALELRETSDDPLLNYFKTSDLIPLGAVSAMEGLQKLALEDYKPSALEDNMNAKRDAVMADVEAKMEEGLANAKKGMVDLPPEHQGKIAEMEKVLDQVRDPKGVTDPEQEQLFRRMEEILPGITAGDPKKLQLKDFSFDKIDQINALAQDFADKKKAQAIEMIKASRDEAVKQLDQVKAMEPAPTPDVLDALQANIRMLDELISGKPQKAALPRLDAEAMLTTVDPQVASALQHLRGVESEGVDAEEMKRLEALIDDAMQSAREAIAEAAEQFSAQYRITAHFMEEGLSPHEQPEEALKKSLGQQLTRRDALVGGDFACMDLSGMNFDGLDMSGCLLEQCNLTGASFKGTKLTGAVLARSVLDDADFSGADMVDANIGAVTAVGTRFEGAVMQRARLGRGRFERVDFSGCDLAESEMLEIELVGCNFKDAKMPMRNFIETRLDGSRFHGAVMPTSMVAKCSCVGTDFGGADLSPSVFVDTVLDHVCFDGANLEKATFASTPEGHMTMKGVSFRNARLDKGCLRDMCLENADFRDASLESTYFGNADLTRADLTGARGRFAQFRNATLTGATCRDMDLREGSIAKAHLVSADFRGSNLYGTDVLRATMGSTRFEGANLDRTLIEDWRPE